MQMKRVTIGAAVLLLALGGCSKTVPAEYASTLSPADPKWQTESCRQMRAEAARYDVDPEGTFTLGKGVLLGPYGIGMAVAGMEHRENKRRQFARDLHLQCSSRPVPQALEVSPMRAATDYQ